MAEFEDKDQKTEEATPRRRQEAREKGQVALSTELVSAVSLIAGLVALALGGMGLFKQLGGLITANMRSLGELGTTEMMAEDYAQLLSSSLTSVLGALSIVVMPAIVVGGLAAYGQVGFKITPQAVELDPSKIDPIKGMGRLVSVRGAVRTMISAAKVILIGITVVWIAVSHVDEVIRMGPTELGPLLGGIGHIALRCAAGALAVILMLGLVDLAFQRYQHEKDLRMSKQELKDDHRLSEGDPHVKARVRQIQRETATRRMMDEVPKATVVVTNPTHFAVALRYDRDDETAAAPVVTAKGVDHIAERIKRVAAASDVICYEDVPLARALYARSRIGQEIPEELFAAVATVLGYVYRLEESAARA